MKSREDYVKALKASLDAWNQDMDLWERRLELARGDAKSRFAKDLERLRAQRENARYQLKLVEDASAEAWQRLSAGAEDAWKRMSEAVEEARENFRKSP